MRMSIDINQLIKYAEDQGRRDRRAKCRRTQSGVWAQVAGQAGFCDRMGLVSRKRQMELTNQLKASQKQAVLQAYGEAVNGTR